MSYTVILHDYPGLRAQERRNLERKFQQTLENALGGPGGVLLAWQAWQLIEDVGADRLQDADWRLAQKWIRAAAHARQAALAGRPDAPDAAFELVPATLEARV